MPQIHKFKTKDYKDLDTVTLIDMLAQETMAYTQMHNRMVADGITPEEYQICKATIADLQAEIESRHNPLPPEEKLFTPYKYW